MRDLVDWMIVNVPTFGTWWYNEPHSAAIVVGTSLVLSLALFLTLYIPLTRRFVLKQRRFGGRWWYPDQYRDLMQVLAEDRDKGRVLSFEEKKALREFEGGKKAVVMPWEKSHGGYY